MSLPLKPANYGCNDNVMFQNFQFLRTLEDVKLECEVALEESEKVLRQVSSGERLLPRALDNHDNATLKSFVVALFAQLQSNCKWIIQESLIHTCEKYLQSPKHVEELHTCLKSADNLLQLNTNIQKAEANSIRLANIEDTCNRLNEQLSGHMTDLENIKSVVTNQSPLDFSQYHTAQMNELESLKSALTDQTPPPAPVFDYARIAALVPKLTPEPTPQVKQQPVFIRDEMKKTSDELEKRFNLIIYGLKPAENQSAYNRVMSMFKDCGIGRFNTLSGSVESAKFLSRDASKPVILVVMRNRFQVEEILGEAWRLRGGKYNGVYLSKDRTIEEREQYKKTVEELKSKIKGCPNTRWAIVDGSVVSKGQFSNESKR